MPRLAANISTLFREVPFLERFGRAAEAGFRHVEFQFPYAERKEDVKAALSASGLELVLFNTPPGRAGVDVGLAIFPERREAFRQSLALALDYASHLGCPRLHCLAGMSPQDSDSAALEDVFLENLRFAAREANALGITLLIEPLNPSDNPGYFLTDADHAARLIARVDARNLFLQYDFYHRSRTGGDLVATFDRLRPLIGHVQIAGNPGRHEPDIGEVDYGFVMRHLDRVGWEGYVGCEWTPAGATADGLGWAKGWLARA